MHTLIAAAGALVAAAGSAVLLARCFRMPRGDLIAWSIGLLGLLISLGAQAMGYASGYDSAIFRAMELGGQVIAPLAFVVALWDVAGRSGAARFCARLYVGALGVIALVVLTLDQLTTTPFTKTWPPPFTYYQAPPNYVLMFVSGGVTAALAVWAVLLVLFRSSQPGWRDAGPGQLVGGLATLALAYPGLAEYAVKHLKVHVPLGSVFTVALAFAALLGWLAGMQSAQLNLAAMHGQGSSDEGRDDRARQPGRDGAGRYRPADGPGWDDQYAADPRRDRGYLGASDDRPGSSYRGDGYFDSGSDGGVYRGGGLYRPDGPVSDLGRGGPDEYRREHQSAGDYADFSTGDFDSAAFGAADAVGGSGWQQQEDRNGRRADGDPRGRDDHEGDGMTDQRRRELFGQITIYTLMDGQVGEFDRLTERVVELVRRREPDTLVFIAHAVPSAPTQRILYQVYRSRGAYQRHLAQPYIQQFDLDRRAYVLATNVVELGLQQAKVSPFPFPSVEDLFPEPGYDTSGFERPDYQREYGRNSAPRGGSSREYR
jgi:quinol monooxygenase YgiN